MTTHASLISIAGVNANDLGKQLRHHDNGRLMLSLNTGISLHFDNPQALIEWFNALADVVCKDQIVITEWDRIDSIAYGIDVAEHRLNIAAGNQ